MVAPEDPDELFLRSLAPELHVMSRMQKLRFKEGVIQLLAKILNEKD